MTMRVEQSVTYVGERRWNWSVWLAGSEAELDRVDHVTYTLHPSFPNPVREIRTRKGGFRLKSSGWGEFTIYLDIVDKDGEHRQLTHDLKLTGMAKPRPAPAEKRSTRGTKFSQTAVSAGEPLLSEEAINDLVQKAVDQAVGATQRIKVFVSGSVADSEAVSKLGSSLEKLDAQVVGSGDAPAGVPYKVSMEDNISQADVAVFLVSGRPNLWQNEEIEAAKRHGKQVVPVLIGRDSQTPDSLSQFSSLRVGGMDEIADLARKVLKK